MSRLNEVKIRSSFHSKYEKLSTLGKGNFGKVYLVEDKNTGEQFAAKVVDKKVFKTGDQKQHALREQRICESFAKGLSHVNIVQVYDVITENDSIYIIMENVEGGELFDRIKQSKGLTENCARKWFREIIEAVQYIHQNNIIHRDLKPENVMLDKWDHIKICDFGFGNIIREGHEVLSTYCGSPFYASPEMVTATPYHGPPADIWSCGVILYAMLTGSLPFQSDDMPQLFQKISQAHYSIPSYVSRDASNLIKRLLCKNAKERITAEECLAHPWLNKKPVNRQSITSQLTLSHHFSFPRKKVPSTTSSSLNETQNYLKINEEPLEKNSNNLFAKLFRKKSQIVPEMTTNKKADSHYDKKSVKSKYLLSRFTGLFKTSLQKRITDK